MKKVIIEDNCNNRREVWSGLKENSRVRAKATKKGLLDVGASGMVVDFEAFIEGETYIISDITWDYEKANYVKDRDNCLHLCDTYLFEPIEN